MVLQLRHQRLPLEILAELHRLALFYLLMAAAVEPSTLAKAALVAAAAARFLLGKLEWQMAAAGLVELVTQALLLVAKEVQPMVR